MDNQLHPVHQTHDGYFNTYSGKKISIHNPTPDMISVEDIAHALSMITRFGGHTFKFYSVAQHSIFVSNLIKADKGNMKLRLHGLMHDASEAYIHDIIKPLKNILGDSYGEIEQRFEAVIAERFDLDLQLMEKIKPYDRQALEIEHAYFFTKESLVCNESYGPQMYCEPEMAERAFWGCFDYFKGGAS